MDKIPSSARKYTATDWSEYEINERKWLPLNVGIGLFCLRENIIHSVDLKK
jgi:hypothetical protein